LVEAVTQADAGLYADKRARKAAERLT